jgi:WhiB family redox-sensing transcriptional regulator
MTDADWQDRAACAEEDPELFFPVSSTGPHARRQINSARAVCARCPVQRECLRWSLRTAQRYGVWGGMEENERQLLLRESERRSVSV